MTKTLITEIIVGLAATWLIYVTWGVIPIMQFILVNSKDNPPLVMSAAGVILTIGVYILIAMFCWGSVLEFLGYYYYELYQSRKARLKREWL